MVVVVLLETVGLWFLHNKLAIYDNRMEAAVFVFQVSVITSFITFTQIPYTASVMSHERMSIFAYVSIIEVVLKLAIVYMLPYGGFDKLKYYALLLLIVQTFIALIYRWYCTRNFEETKKCMINSCLLKIKFTTG